MGRARGGTLKITSALRGGAEGVGELADDRFAAVLGARRGFGSEAGSAGAQRDGEARAAQLALGFEALKYDDLEGTLALMALLGEDDRRYRELALRMPALVRSEYRQRWGTVRGADSHTALGALLDRRGGSRMGKCLEPGARQRKLFAEIQAPALVKLLSHLDERLLAQAAPSEDGLPPGWARELGSLRAHVDAEVLTQTAETLSYAKSKACAAALSGEQYRGLVGELSEHHRLARVWLQRLSERSWERIWRETWGVEGACAPPDPYALPGAEEIAERLSAAVLAEAKRV